MTAKPDLYQQITDRFIAALEAGTRPWVCDWLRYGEPLRSTGQSYRGINRLMLSMIGAASGYENPYWMTFKQALDLGGAVRKGEKASQIVFFKRLEIGDRDGAGDGETGDEERRFVPLLRAYHVFNVDQIDGLPEGKFLPQTNAQLPAKQRDELAESALRATGAVIAEDGGHRAFYRSSTDSIHLPAFDRFKSTSGYLATMAHELTHWTGAHHRLDRLASMKFGGKDYAFEELVAEIGASFVCARLGIAGEHFDNHAAYVASWLERLRSDKKAIFRAAALAQSAADLILGEAAAVEAPAAAPVAAPVRQFALALA